MRRIVILGGGYAGLHAAAALRRRLARQLRQGSIGLTVVSRDPYHTYHGWTGEVLAGRLAVGRTLTPIAPMLHEHFFEGDVVGLDTSARSIRVQTAAGELQELAYDHLLLATGSRDPFSRVDGLAEHGWCVKNTRSMQRLVARLDVLDRQPGALRNVVVVGGGMAGVETASALALRFRKRAGTAVNVHLVAAHDRLLDSLRPSFAHIADHADRTLRAQGVEVHYGRRVASIAADSVLFRDGSRLPADLAVVTAGIEFECLPGTEALPRTAEGQLATDAALRVAGRDDIWAAGDIAAVHHPLTGALCPTNALWAMKQGDCVGRNMARAVVGKQPRPFGFKGLGQAAGLMQTNGIAELYRLQFTGKAAWLLRILFFAWYMPHRRNGFAIVGRLVSDWLAPRARVAGMVHALAGRMPRLAGARLAIGRLPRP